MPVRSAIRLIQALPVGAAARRTAVSGRGQRPTPWWLWPHLLSLDAPLVAVLWQGWWARVAHTGLAWRHAGVLWLGVWLIYLTDRLVDVARYPTEDPLSSRHAFHDRWRVGLSLLATTVAASLTLLTPWVLTRTEFLHGLVLLGFAALYFWLTHGRRRLGWTRCVPKEVAVGGMFALGTAFFPLCLPSVAVPVVWLGVAIFGGICFCNCALISAWERNTQDQRDPASLLNAFPRLVSRLRGLCLGLAGLAVLGWLGTGRALFLPLALSGLGLAWLDACRPRFTLDALRVLADAVLLTPPLFWALAPFVSIHLFPSAP